MDIKQAISKVIEGVDLMIERGSKIAFVGQNGQGKSTLAKIIVGEIDYEGELKLGHNVKIGYFAQNQSEYLEGEKTVLETMEDAASDSNRFRVRDMLGAFLFRGDEVDKKVREHFGIVAAKPGAGDDAQAKSAADDAKAAAAAVARADAGKGRSGGARAAKK